MKCGEKALEEGKWEESADLIAKSQVLLARGGASDKECRLAEQLLVQVREAKEASEARVRGLEALAAGEVRGDCVMLPCSVMACPWLDFWVLLKSCVWPEQLDEPAGETYVQQKQMDKAQAEADRAREELVRGRAYNELSHRLATLEAAISATSEALRWRQKAFQELDAAARNLELLQVHAFGFVLVIVAVFPFLEDSCVLCLEVYGTDAQ